MTTKMNEEEMIRLFISDEITLLDIDEFVENNGIDSLDRDGRSILFTAIVENQVEIVSYLIKKGSSVHLQDKEALSPLHFAVIYDNPKIVQLLIQNGADLEARDRWGNTLLMRAKVAKLLHKEELMKLLSNESTKFTL